MTFGGHSAGPTRAQLGPGTGGGTLGHITSTKGRYGPEYAYLVNAGVPAPAPRIEHKLTHRFGMWREESAPGFVVSPATGRSPSVSPEAQPPLHVCFGNPHALFPTLLAEDHDVGHASVGTLRHPMMISEGST